MLREGPPDRAQQRMDAVGNDDRQCRVTADNHSGREQFADWPSGEQLGSGYHIVNPEGHHNLTLAPGVTGRSPPSVELACPTMIGWHCYTVSGEAGRRARPGQTARGRAVSRGLTPRT
ncbi:hypothetical protein Raf01_49170 [Rugosimonospora africana]|uniref:Uncharacterized protein n=1 Tax=Rugosimonospora africana TaxID=556532 RepID=A0A8J3QVT7_9ACTN|nr:hypothetical protein Raf01_49170 [Rugosimonospora africana]